MTRLVHWLGRSGPVLRREEGQTMAEYAVVLGVLIVAAAATILVFATTVHSLLQNSIIAILNGI